ncbi:Transcriptional regulator, TetR family [Oxalobacteraceae bacterium IMCC9480]|nr:Transcriptional regulator, TetR family [Oxalobacteraceae bacterium IMCC9480]NDP59156.1 TetR/AcrR family transcriptional regulator [Oxalobacteraceae bacterium]
MIPCPFKTPPRWTRRKEARPQELLDAALALFVERGFSATRLDDVARIAGVSKGTLYLYYASKEELFKAVVRENVVPLLGEAEAMIRDHAGSSALLLRQILLGWWERIGETRLSGITKLVMAEARNFPELAKFYNEEVILRGNAMLAQVLERGVASGEFRPLDITQATSVIAAPIMMMMMWKHSFGSPCALPTITPQAYLHGVTDLLLQGLLHHEDRPPAGVI